MDRIRLAFKVLFVPKIIVVTKNEQFSTFDNATAISDSKHISIEVVL